MILLSMLRSMVQAGPVAPSGACGFLCHVNAYSTVVVAFATVALFLVGWLSYRRERNRERERTTAVDSQIGALAYALRQRSFLLSGFIRGEFNAASPARLREGVRLMEHGEDRLQEMLALAPNASPDVGSAVRASAIAFYSARITATTLAGLTDLPDEFFADAGTEGFRDLRIPLWKTTAAEIESLGQRLDGAIGEDFHRALVEAPPFADVRGIWREVTEGTSSDNGE